MLQIKIFINLIAKSDNDVMQPLRKYEAKLDKQTIENILSIHNILAQYYPNATPNAIEMFEKRKNDFYQQIDEANNFIKPDLILIGSD